MSAERGDYIGRYLDVDEGETWTLRDVSFFEHGKSAIQYGVTSAVLAALIFDGRSEFIAGGGLGGFIAGWIMSNPKRYSTDIEPLSLINNND